MSLDIEWKEVLADELEKPYLLELKREINERKDREEICPPLDKVFEAFRLCPYSEVKVVLLGQDPYHTPGMAHGLSFSVLGSKIPPSLKNIFKELKNDLGTSIPSHGDLTALAKQGVLLLNSSLTTKAGQALAHSDLGWERFTDRVIQIISENKNHIVFMLWGSHAKSKNTLIDNDKHYVLEAAHPSPFSAHRGFFGCQHFSKANSYLLSNGLKPINWQLEEK